MVRETLANDRHQPPRRLVFPRPAGDLSIERRDPLVEVAQTIDQNLQRRPRRLRQRVVLRLDEFGQATRVPRPLWHNSAELGQVTSERVDRLRALPAQKLAHPEDGRCALLLLALHRRRAGGTPSA